mgnify:CR=1 FL=1
MKKHIVKALHWALKQFEEPQPSFPVLPVKTVKKRPQVKKATTRTVKKSK